MDYNSDKFVDELAGMDLEQADELDALIESALREEPAMEAPLTLHRRVNERVRIAAVREKERVRFRYSMMTMGVAFLAALGIAGVVVTVVNLQEFVNHGVPGGWGRFDNWTTTLQASSITYSGAYTMVLSVVLAVGTLLLGIVPLRRHFSNHG